MKPLIKKQSVLKEETPQLNPTLFEESTPTKAFSVEKDEKGNWYFVTYKFDKEKMVTRQVTGPTMRAIVIDEFKIEAQRFIEELG